MLTGEIYTKPYVEGPMAGVRYCDTIIRKCPEKNVKCNNITIDVDKLLCLIRAGWGPEQIRREFALYSTEQANTIIKEILWRLKNV